MADSVPSPMPESYESAVAELERLISRIDSGDIALDELLSQYRRGAELLAFCRSRLEAVEAQIKVVDEGLPKPWAPT